MQAAVCLCFSRSILQLQFGFAGVGSVGKVPVGEEGSHADAPLTVWPYYHVAAGWALCDTADKVMLWMVFQREKALGVPPGKAGPLSAVAQQGSAKFELLCTEMPRGSWGRLLGTCYWATLKPTSGACWPGWQRVHLGGILFVVHQCPVSQHQL